MDVSDEELEKMGVMEFVMLFAEEWEKQVCVPRTHQGISSSQHSTNTELGDPLS